MELSNVRKLITPYKVCISTSHHHTVGLKVNGTVIAVGHIYYGQCDTQDWRDIVAVSAGSWHTAGLKINGTVVAIGHNEYGQCNTLDWRDIGVDSERPLKIFRR